jgi:hypothetical protein
MKHRGRLPDIPRRAETGPVISEKEFEAMLITHFVNRLIKKCGIHYDKDMVIPYEKVTQRAGLTITCRWPGI